MGQLIAKLMGIFGKQCLVGHIVPWSSGLALTQPFSRMLPKHKVVIVGVENAEKTTTLYHFLMNEVVHMGPTIGSNMEEIVLQKTHFLMWDMGGQEALCSTWNTYCSNTEAAHWAPVDAVSGHCRLMSQPEANQKLWKFCLDYVDGKPK